MQRILMKTVLNITLIFTVLVAAVISLHIEDAFHITYIVYRIVRRKRYSTSIFNAVKISVTKRLRRILLNN